MNLNSKNYRHNIFASFFLAAILLCASNVIAQGNLMIYPKRVVFEDSKRSQDLSLSNNGKDTARYVISVIQIRMKADGSFETISDPDSAQRFADKNFRFFPRTVVLAPNEAQTVKVQLIRTNELIPGEYRSHLYFRAETEKKPLGERELSKKKTAIGVSLVPVFGISVPVIIKVGESTTKIAITEPSFTAGKNSNPEVRFTVTRSGNMSAYGNITIEHTSASGKKTVVSSMQGVAIYLPTRARKFQLRLDATKGVSYNSGRLRIFFSEQSAKSIPLAQTEIVLD